MGLLVESSDELCFFPSSGPSRQRGDRAHFSAKWPHVLSPACVFGARSRFSALAASTTARARGRSLSAGRYSGCWVIGGCGCLEGPCSPRGRDGSFMLRSPIYPYMPCLVCLVFWPTTRARPPVRHLVALSGRSLRRPLRVQVVAEGLAHSLVTWSTLALDVFPAWSPAWFMILRKEDLEHRANSGFSRATSSPSRLWSQSAIANKVAIAHRSPHR